MAILLSTLDFDLATVPNEAKRIEDLRIERLYYQLMKYKLLWIDIKKDFHRRTDFPEEELFCQKSAKVTLSKIGSLLYTGQVHDLTGS